LLFSEGFSNPCSFSISNVFWLFFRVFIELDIISGNFDSSLKKYRPQISHALDQGMNPVEVAQLTGHDVQTLYESYAGNVNSRPRLPEIFR
jgi:hypothetical protein